MSHLLRGASSISHEDLLSAACVQAERAAGCVAIRSNSRVKDLRRLLQVCSPEPPQDQVAEAEEHDYTSPKDPLVLFRPSFHHSYGVTADAEGIGDAVELPLCAFQHFALLTEIPEHCSAAFQELIELGVC